MTIIYFTEKNSKRKIGFWVGSIIPGSGSGSTSKRSGSETQSEKSLKNIVCCMKLKNENITAFFRKEAVILIMTSKLSKATA
jgi:hypothetical protein